MVFIIQYDDLLFPYQGSPNAQVPSQCHGSPNIAGASVPIPSMHAAAVRVTETLV